MIYVGGYPLGFLKNDVTSRDGLALIPISNKHGKSRKGEQELCCKCGRLQNPLTA
jgi:hypothetical protein